MSLLVIKHIKDFSLLIRLLMQYTFFLNLLNTWSSALRPLYLCCPCIKLKWHGTPSPPTTLPYPRPEHCVKLEDARKIKNDVIKCVIKFVQLIFVRRHTFIINILLEMSASWLTVSRNRVELLKFGSHYDHLSMIVSQVSTERHFGQLSDRFDLLFGK